MNIKYDQSVGKTYPSITVQVVQGLSGLFYPVTLLAKSFQAVK